MTHILKAFASDSFISIAIQKQYKFTGSKTTIFQVRALTVCRSNDASLALEKTAKHSLLIKQHHH